MSSRLLSHSLSLKVEREHNLDKMFKKFHKNHLEINCKRCSINSNNGSTLHKSTIVAHRLSIHFQNLLLPSKSPQKYIDDINNHIAVFRDLLILVGQNNKDCPELREKIRKLRSTLVDECKNTADIFIAQAISSSSDDNHYLVLLFHLLQLFLRELYKCYRLVEIVPMDMKDYYENRTGPSNLGNVISEILLCKQITPDFTQEELSSISMDSQEITLLLNETQKHIPKELNSTLDIHNSWPLKPNHSLLSKNCSLLCCVSKPNF